ncbi:citramalyl-CoA lyase, mitochondrial-like isoform X1 [Asterias rubens]|uniref:citramalyl-CoA lyase, mitochondrial-like isoform X1 n=1 Tax=Asterias rubens TaxID=7604 RepID=UPI00145566ED|nr:citramalyl-CoA lyase, mitochondrial-like isoform X1 [Asterias rubens]
MLSKLQLTTAVQMLNSFLRLCTRQAPSPRFNTTHSLVIRGFMGGQTTNGEGGQSFTPRRAVLYVPGSDERKLAKLAGLTVDCAVMDCEDGVAANRKDVARQTIRKTLDSLHLPTVGDVAVRINAVDCGLAGEDLDEILKAERLPDTLMLPKVESVQHIQWLTEKLQHNFATKPPPNPLKLVIFVESAMGLLRLANICEEGQRLSQTAPFTLEGVVFGSDDFCADIGATRTPEAAELLYARQKVITVAKAYRLQAIDLVHIDFKDLESLEKQSLEGARMGFTGKQVIHPTQIPVVQKAFSPSPEKMEWAKALIEAFEDHQHSGKVRTHKDNPTFLYRVSKLHLSSAKRFKIIRYLSNLPDYILLFFIFVFPPHRERLHFEIA